MKKTARELQALTGIGEVLSKRLIDAGYDTFDKIAAAGKEGLKKINGLDRLPLKPIIEEAASLARQEGEKKKAGKLKELKAAEGRIRGQVEGLAGKVKDQFGDGLTEKGMGKIEKQLLKITVVLDKVESKLESRVKRAAKALPKAEKRLAGTADGTQGPTEVITELKKARRLLKKIYRP